MPSVSERTHAKNIENLHIANSIIAGIGASFNPNNLLIKADKLTEFETKSTEKLATVNEIFTDEQTAIGAQIAAFNLVSKRVTKIIKAAQGQGLSVEFMDNLRSTANRLNGVRVSAKTPDDPLTPGDESQSNHSVSRRSYAGILETLDLLDEQLKNNPAYAPNEDEYKPATVTTWVTSLRGIHNAALDAKVATKAARSERDLFIYNPTDGIMPRTRSLKAYVETILDASDTRLKQLKKLKFVDYSK